MAACTGSINSGRSENLFAYERGKIRHVLCLMMFFQGYFSNNFSSRFMIKRRTNIASLTGKFLSQCGCDERFPPFSGSIKNERHVNSP